MEPSTSSDHHTEYRAFPDATPTPRSLSTPSFHEGFSSNPHDSTVVHHEAQPLENQPRQENQVYSSRLNFQPGDGGQPQNNNAFTPGNMQNSSASSHKPFESKPREFNGSSAWEDYKSHFDTVCYMNGWVHDLRNILWVQLSGAALEFARSLPRHQAQTFEQLCDALNSRLVPLNLLKFTELNYLQEPELQENPYRRWLRTSDA